MYFRSNAEKDAIKPFIPYYYNITSGTIKCIHNDRNTINIVTSRAVNIFLSHFYHSSMKTRGHRGPSGRRVRGRATAEPLINSEGAMRWPAAKVTTSDTKSATWR